MNVTESQYPYHSPGPEWLSAQLPKSCAEKHFTWVTIACHALGMSDTCEIRDIRIPCTIGIDPWEEATPQVVVVHLWYPVNGAAAARTEDITQTVDYRAVADGVFRAHEGGRFKLLETAAESVATWVLQHTPVSWVEVAVTKDITKTAAKTATIHIRRERI